MSRETEKVYIVGISESGLAGLSPVARELVSQADLLVGDQEVLDLVTDLPAEKLEVTSDWATVCDRIAQELGRRRIVVLATGDPLFYGVARYLTDRIGKERVEIIPHVSTMQLAFARIKESWDDAYFVDLSQRDLEDILDRVRSAEKVGFFTSPVWPPYRIAQVLLESRMDYFIAYVCENLGSPDERITRAELEEIASMSFAPLNVMILVRKAAQQLPGTLETRPRRFGNPDAWFARSPERQALLTFEEIRSIALAKLAIQEDDIVWDIGAGTGSVAIEAAMLAPKGTVYAVEKSAGDFRLLQENIERFGTRNVVPVHGPAPDALHDLPAPHAVFVGAIGRELAPVLHDVYQRLRPGGRLVVHTAPLDHLMQALEELRHAHEEPDVCLLQICRAVYQLGSIRFDPLPPSFLLAVQKRARRRETS